LPAILGCNKPTHCLEITIPNPNKEFAPHTKTAYIPGNPEAKDTINRIHQLVKSKKLFQAEMDVKRGLIYKCILPNLAFNMHDLKELSMKKLLEELAEQEK
uniref:Uncharacterized protein n=1 Tax=Ciona savignyi TaxID=51511 RepID=H2Z3X5_CIOSA